MKTPEEIKKGLEVCRADECHGHHTGCPYDDDFFCIMHICGDALALIEHLDAKVPKWISVEERMPECMQPVIVCREGGKVEQGYKDTMDWWKVYGTRTKKVTHWMPLPEPPEEEGD